MMAWHFVAADRRLRFEHNGKAGVVVSKGLVLTCDPERLELCRYGLHASVGPLDALLYAPGPVVCRVEVSGRILRGDDKVVAERREVLAWRDCSRELRLFAVWCARRALMRERKAGREPDQRSWAACDVAEAFARGDATADQLAAAWAAAWAAAGDAAGAAARAARAAAWAAARDAAWAARDAERKAQSRKLSAMLREAVQ